MSSSPSSNLDTLEMPAPGRGLVRVMGRICLMLLKVFVYTLVMAWAALAIYYSNLPGWARPMVSLLFVAGGIASLILIKSRLRRLITFWGVFALLVLWWKFIPASNERNWQRDLAVLPWAQIDGTRVTLHNIRNCTYRSTSDFDVSYYDRTFDLKSVNSADLYVVTWGSPHIAHTMMSFDLGDDHFLCFSIETRKEIGEDYSVIKGFFKQYELMYVAADERDLIRLRTNFRREQVYLYRLKADPAVVKAVLLGYLKSCNSLRDRAEWYNALTSNCLTNIRGHTLPYAANKHWDWRFLFNGHLDELMYERKSIDTSIPLAELKAKSLINDKAIAVSDAADFSKAIRQGLPGIDKK